MVLASLLLFINNVCMEKDRSKSFKNREAIEKLNLKIAKTENKLAKNVIKHLLIGGSWGFIGSLFVVATKYKDDRLCGSALALSGAHAINSLIMWLYLLGDSGYLEKELEYLKNQRAQLEKES